MRIAPVGVFAWVDIVAHPQAFLELGFSVDDGLRALHVRDADGVMHVGVEAFAVIWRKLPYWWVLAVVVSLPVVRTIARVIYARFAQWRFKRLGYAQCGV